MVEFFKTLCPEGSVLLSGSCTHVNLDESHAGGNVCKGFGSALNLAKAKGNYRLSAIAHYIHNRMEMKNSTNISIFINQGEKRDKYEVAFELKGVITIPFQIK